MDIDNIVMVLVLIVLAGTLYNMYAYYRLYDEHKEIVFEYNELNHDYMNDVCKKEIKDEITQKYAMCGSLIDRAEFGVTGIYLTDKYYCVWTGTDEDVRTVQDITKTELHEACHHLIAQDEENHFCKS